MESFSVAPDSFELLKAWNADAEDYLFAEQATTNINNVVGIENYGNGATNIARAEEIQRENKVKHSYVDHADDDDGAYTAIEVLRKTGGSLADQPFPCKMHFALHEIEKDGMAHIVSWQPHGRCFKVHNQKLFCSQVLGNWFRMSKYPSFQRQLNIYGFSRLTAGPDKGGYYHELFLRGKPGLTYRIQRHKLKGTGTRKAASPETEPNFYQMTSLPPSNASNDGIKKEGQKYGDQSPSFQKLPSSAVLPCVGGFAAESGCHCVVSTAGTGTGCFSLQSLAPSLLASSGCFRLSNAHQTPSEHRNQQQLLGTYTAVGPSSSAAGSLGRGHPSSVGGSYQTGTALFSETGAATDLAGRHFFTSVMGAGSTGSTGSSTTGGTSDSPTGNACSGGNYGLLGRYGSTCSAGLPPSQWFMNL